MAHNTPGRLRIGRHPAMWQSVPIGSFIQQSASQCAVSEDKGEQPVIHNLIKKNMTGLKYFPPRNKDDRCPLSKNNRPTRNDESADKTSHNNEMYQARANLNPNSAQRQHHGDFSRHANNVAFHSYAQNQTFLSNEDDFPSLSDSASTNTLEAAIATPQIPHVAMNVSYSEKLKLTHQTIQQLKMERSEISVERERTVNSHEKKSFSDNLLQHDKKHGIENRKYHPTGSTPANRQGLSKPQYRASNRINKESLFSNARDESHYDQINANPVPKTESRDQRGKTQNRHLNAKANGKTTEEEIGHVKSNFRSKPQGSPSGSNFNTRSRSTLSNADAMNNRSVGNAKIEIKSEWSQPSKVLYRNKRPVMDGMKEKYFSLEVPDHKNVPNERSAGRMVAEVKNDVSRSSQGSSKYPVTRVRERGNHFTSELPTNQENAKNSQQGTTSKSSKKRKNRKSKLKRNVAFQTGKIMILTPELYSRFTGSVETGNHRTMQDFSFDLGDMEEYPELGQINNNSSKQQKIVKPEMDNSRNPESDPVISKQPLLNGEITSVEGSSTSQITTSLLCKNPTGPSTIAVSEQNVRKAASKALGTNETDKCEKPCCVPRKRVDPRVVSAGEEKETSLASEQKTKTRHDGSIQISFSDILSSTMVKVKSEISKSKKQGDSRVKVISSKKVKMDKNLHVPPNALDSSRPVIKRGKERERPKPKKYTALKRIILKERSEKKLGKIMLVKAENLKNDTAFQNGIEVISSSPILTDVEIISSSPVLSSAEEQYILPADKVKTEPEIDAADPDSVLLNDFSFEELALELHDEEKDKSPDQNVNILVEEKPEYVCEKALEEVYDYMTEEKKMQAVQIAIHTCHFREYCNHLLSAEIDQVTLSLLGDLTRFQDRLHQKDPIKARVRRRLVYGIKEVTKHLKLKKVKCVILAPDSENIKSKGGLNDAVTEIVRVSAEYHIPCVFALRRKTLGRACLKAVPVSCVGVFNYDGSEANFKKLIELQAESKKAYDAVMSNLKELITVENVEQLIETRENSPQSLQLLRITILREQLLEKNPDLHLVFTPSGNLQLGHKEE